MKCKWKSYQACQTCLNKVCENGMKEEDQIREEIARIEHEMTLTTGVTVSLEYKRALAVRLWALRWVTGEFDV